MGGKKKGNVDDEDDRTPEQFYKKYKENCTKVYDIPVLKSIKEWYENNY